MKYYVRVSDGSHSPYPIYAGTSLKKAKEALVSVERTLYAILATATVTHNMNGLLKRREWVEGCPPDDASVGFMIESCPKCGLKVTREDAFVDEGEGEEAGRTFYYCSERCRETH